MRRDAAVVPEWRRHVQATPLRSRQLEGETLDALKLQRQGPDDAGRIAANGEKGWRHPRIVNSRSAAACSPC